MASRDVEFVLRARDEGRSTLEQAKSTFDRLADANKKVAEGALKSGDALGRLQRDLDALAAKKAAVESVGKLADVLAKAEERTRALAEKLPALQQAEQQAAQAAKAAADALAQQQAVRDRAKASFEAESASLRKATAELREYVKEQERAERAVRSRSKDPTGALAAPGPKATPALRDAYEGFEKAKAAADAQRASVEALTAAVARLKQEQVAASAPIRSLTTASTSSASEAGRRSAAAASATKDAETAAAALAVLREQATAAQSALGGVAIRQDAIKAASASLISNIDAVTAALKRHNAAAREGVTASPFAGPAAERAAAYRASLPASRLPRAQDDLNAVRADYERARADTTSLGKAVASGSASPEQVAQFNASRLALSELRESYFAAARAVNALQAAETQRRAAALASAEASKQAALAAQQQAAAAQQAAQSQTSRYIGPAPQRLFGGAGRFYPSAGQEQNTATIAAGRAFLKGAPPDPTPWQRLTSVMGQARNTLLGTGQAAEEGGNLFRMFGARTIALVAAFAGFHAIKNQLEQVVETIRVVDAAANRLGVVMGGSSSRAAQEFTFLTAEARRLGIPLKELLDYYGRFAMAGQEVGLSNEQVRKSFTALMETARVAKLSEGERNRLFIAADDVLSKGKLQAQEVRQFSNVVPGASHIMSKALGMTRPELSAAMQKGSVDVTPEAFERMMQGFGSRFGGQVGEATKTTTTEVDRLKNSIFELQAQFAEGGFSEGLRTALQALNEEMAKPETRQGVRDLGATVGELAKSFVAAIPTIIALGKALAAAFAAFAIWKGAGLIISGISALAGPLSVVMQGARTTWTVLSMGGPVLTALGRGAVMARLAFVGLGYSIPVLGQVLLAVTALGAAWSWWTSKSVKAPDLTNAVAETKSKLAEIQTAFKENGESVDGLQEKIKAKGWKVEDADKAFKTIKGEFDKSKDSLLKDTDLKIKTKLDTSGLEAGEIEKLKASFGELTSGATNVQQFSDSMRHLRDTTESLKGQKFLSEIIEQANKTGALEDNMSKAALVAKTLGSTQAEVAEVMRKYNMTLGDLVKNHNEFAEAMRKAERASSEFGAAMGKVDEHIRKSAEGAAKYAAVVTAVQDGQKAVTAALKEQKAAEDALSKAKTTAEKEAAQDQIELAKRHLRDAQEKQPEAVKAAADAAVGIEHTDEEKRKLAFSESSREARQREDALKDIEKFNGRVRAAERAAAAATTEDDRKEAANRIAAAKEQIEQRRQIIAGLDARPVGGNAIEDAQRRKKERDDAAEAKKKAEKQKEARDKFNSEFDEDVQKRQRKAAEELPLQQAKSQLAEAKRTGVGMEDAQAAVAAAEREKAINEAVAKEVEKAKGKADRLGEDFQIDPARLEVLRQMAAAEFDAKNVNLEQEQVKERLVVAEKVLGDLIARRKDIESQIVTGREQGTRSPEEIAQLKSEYGQLTIEAGKAADSAERLATALGYRKAVDHIRVQRDGLREYQKGLLDLDSLGTTFADGMVGAFEKTATALGSAIDGTKKWGDAWKAVGDAFRNFAADFLMTVAKMILKQALLNALGLGEKKATDSSNSGGVIGALKSFAPTIGGTPLFGGSVPVNSAMMAGGAGGGGVGSGLLGSTSPLYGPKTVSAASSASVPALVAANPRLAAASTPAARSTPEAAAFGKATEEAAVKAGVPAPTARMMGEDAAARSAAGGGVPLPPRRPAFSAPAASSPMGLRGTLDTGGATASLNGMSPGQLRSSLTSRLQSDLGLSREQAAGVTGNLAHETQGFTKMTEVGGGGYGLGMWTGSRRRDLETFAAQQGKPASDLDTQYAFLKQEITGKSAWAGRGSLAELKQQASTSDAARYFSDRFERPGVPHMDRRLAEAERAYRSQPEQVASASPGGGGNSPYEFVPGLNYNRGQMSDVKGLVFHHTGGRGDTAGVINTLNQRRLGVQYVMERDGTVKQIMPDGARAAHMRNAEDGSGLSNKNAIGIEMIAKNDADLTPEQRAAGIKFADDMRAKYPGIGDRVFGHGELNAHKQESEGMGVVSAWRAQQQNNMLASADRTPVGSINKTAYTPERIDRAPIDAALAEQQKETARVEQQAAQEAALRNRQSFEQQQAAQVAQQDAARRQQLEQEQAQAEQAAAQQQAQQEQLALQQQQAAEQAAQMQQAAQPSQMPDMSSMFSGMFSSIGGMLGGKGGAGGMMSGLMGMVPKLLQMLFGGLFGGGGGLFAGLFHEGGIAGTVGGMGRMAPAAAFASAVRYHSGGLVGFQPDEVPAVLQRNEEVLTQNDPRHRSNAPGGKGGQGGGSNVAVYLVHDQGEAMKAALETPHGTEAIIQHVSSNRDAYKGALK